MDNIDKLIGSLATDLKPVRPEVSPAVILLRWLVASLLWLLAMHYFFGTRDDLTQRLTSLLFSTEIISLSLIIITCAISVTYLSYPDQRQKPWIIYLPVIPVFSFIIIMYVALMNDVPHPPSEEPGYMCLLCIMAFSSVPSFVIFRELKKQATTKPMLAGALAMVASTALGCLALRICEQYDDVAHTIIWHYLPILGFSFIGLLVGRKLLKW
jgi:hypothetical protein